MTTIISRHKWQNIAALLLLLPSAWFIGINILDELGISGPYYASEPILENWGIGKSLGWNINGVIVCGPFIALFLSALQVLHIKWNFSKEEFQFNIHIRRKWFPLFIAFVSCLLLTTIFIYAVVENF